MCSPAFFNVASLGGKPYGEFHLSSADRITDGFFLIEEMFSVHDKHGIILDFFVWESALRL